MFESFVQLITSTALHSFPCYMVLPKGLMFISQQANTRIRWQDEGYPEIASATSHGEALTCMEASPVSRAGAVMGELLSPSF